MIRFKTFIIGLALAGAAACGQTHQEKLCQDVCSNMYRCADPDRFSDEIGTKSDCRQQCGDFFDEVRELENDACVTAVEDIAMCLIDISDCDDFIRWADQRAGNPCETQDAAAASSCLQADRSFKNMSTMPGLHSLYE